jgi:thiol-disulfide isomerase/thioredoxin
MLGCNFNIAVQCGVVATLLTHQSLALAQDENPVILIAYRVSDLAVWRVDNAGQPHFDASILISHLRAEVEPSKWSAGEANVVEDTTHKSLEVAGTRDIHQKVREFLKRKGAFANPEQRLKEKLATAVSSQRLLIFAGDPYAKVTEDFFDAEVGDYSPTTLKSILGDFKIQCITPQQAKQLNICDELPSGDWPRLAVLKPNGSLVAVANAKDFCQEGRLDGESLEKFLRQHSLVFPDAKAQLKDAMAEALTEDKRVLLQMGGPNCGPCVMLSRYLDDQSALIFKDYIHVKLDTRMAGARELAAEYVDGIDLIPWMAVLSSDGKVLANSISEQGNIAFPRGDVAEEHFRKMLRITRKRLTDAEIDELVDEIPN